MDTATTIQRPVRHPAAVLTVLLAVVASMVGSLTAWAQPAGAAEMTDKQLSVSVELTPRCQPQEGFEYKITLHHAPKDSHWNNVAQWREKGSDQHQTVYGDSGFVASDTGDFEVRAIAIENVSGHFFERAESDWVDVTVSCPKILPPGGGDTEPSVTIDLEPVCDPEPGINYQVTLHNGPAGPHAYSAAWQELPAGESGAESGKSGFLATGEGEFEVHGMAKGILVGAETFTSQPQVVTVDCGDAGDDEDDDEDKPRKGNPDYTG